MPETAVTTRTSATGMQALRACWLAICILGVVAIFSLSVVDILGRSRKMMYSSDEIINLDAILTFFSTGDYTSARFGSVRFNPLISSGVLATWVHGTVFLLGGNLLVARVCSTLLHLFAGSALIVICLRAKGFGLHASLLFATGIWMALSFLPMHRELEIVNASEMWGFLLLAAGLLFVRRQPWIAALWWGLSVWLCKVIYLPFAVAFLLAHALSERQMDGTGVASRAAWRTQTLVFFLPLVVWMGVIGLRYDLSTVVRWAFSYASFLMKHGTDLGIDTGRLPVLDGWSFLPHWGTVAPFVAQKPSVAVPALIAVSVGPLSAVARIALGRRGILPPCRRETYLLALGSGATVLMTTWFLAMDPTQWGRHLLPAIYVSIGIAIYCAADVWSRMAWVGRAAITAVGVACLYWCASAILADWRLTHWRMSYAATCRAPGLLEPPCRQDQALLMMRQSETPLYAGAETCDAQCFAQTKESAIAYGRQVLAERPDDLREIYAVGYALISLQHNALCHDEQQFIRDLRPLLCPEESMILRRYFEEAGLDTEKITRECAAPPRTAAAAVAGVPEV